MAANFHEDLKRGKDAEKKFLEIHPWDLEFTDHRKWDFNGPDGKNVELKADFWCPTKTENLFIERWSNWDKKKPGGIWQARDNGANVFCYWFVKGGFWLECRDVDALVDHLETRIETIKPFRVLNRGWISVGYRVPRNSLKEHFDIYRLS